MQPRTAAGRVRLFEQEASVREVEALFASWRENYSRLESVFSGKPSDPGHVTYVTYMLRKWAHE